MRRTELFCETRRENPADADITGHQLLLRGGFIQPLAAGIYSYLPLGERVKAKIEHLLREEMDAIGGQEISLPVVHPAELWQETGRWYEIGDDLLVGHCQHQVPLVAIPEPCQIVTDLLRKQVSSYRQLPLMLYQIQTKFRDESRPRGGLIRAREFAMKDAYSCHASFEDLDRYYPKVRQAYFNIFRRAGLDVIAVESDTGMMGGSDALEFMLLSEVGEDQLVQCDECGYRANSEAARFWKEAAPREEMRPLEEIYTPDTETIAALANLLKVPESHIAKAALFVDGDRLIFTVVRGDAVGALGLRPAGAEELESSGIAAGYASPVGVKGVTVVVDDLVAGSSNLVAGANKPGYHLMNTKYGRDYEADIVTDIAAAYEGAPCPECGSPVRFSRGVEVGHIFKLGTRYSEPMRATFLDERGESRPIVMASYGIGVGRLIVSIAQGCKDDRGLIWPVAIAPFEVCLVGVDLNDDHVRPAAEFLYNDLTEQGVEVLYDNRLERAGVKFNGADLLGIPLRLVISSRTLRNGAVELKARAYGEPQEVSIVEAPICIRGELDRMQAEITVRAEAKS